MNSDLNWEHAEKVFWKIFALCNLLALPFVYYWYDIKGVVFCILGALCFAAEFLLIIMVVRLLLGLRKASFPVVVGVFLGKLLLWLVLAGAPFWLPLGAGIPFGIGCATFALALVALLISQSIRTKSEKQG